MSEVDKFLNAVEGSVAPSAQQGGEMHCDECDAIIQPGSNIGIYCSNWEILGRVGDDVFVGLQRAYCEECRIEEPRLPKKGAIELMLYASVDEELRTKNPELVSASLSAKGVDWDVKELFEWLMLMPAEFAVQQIGGLHIGPEDVIGLVHNHGMEPDDVLDSDGNLIDTEETRKLREESFEETLEERGEEEKEELDERIERIKERNS